MYAQVAIPIPIDRLFTYRVPPAMAPGVDVGCLVQVSFRNRAEYAVVVELSDERPPSLPEEVEVKPVQALLHPEPLLSRTQLQLAQWMASYYHAPLSSALEKMLPPGISDGRDLRLRLLGTAPTDADGLAGRILSLLRQRGVLRGDQITRALHGIKRADWKAVVDELAQAGYLTVEPFIRPPRTKAKTVQTVQLAIAPHMIEVLAPTLGKHSRRADVLEGLAGLVNREPMRQTVVSVFNTTDATLKKLMAEGDIRLEDERVILALDAEALRQRLIALRDGHASLACLRFLAQRGEPVEVEEALSASGCPASDFQRLEADGLILLGERPFWRDELAHTDYPAPVLTEQQHAVLEPILHQVNQYQHETFLLHGVTGSGKTEIYLHAIMRILQQGRTAYLLVPEIALTPQTAQRVAGRFPRRVAILHSGMNEAERYDVWRRAQEGSVQVIVGARSALFAPLPHVGIIILDEAHDPSYKQHPNVDLPPFRSAPHYDTRLLAQKMGEFHNAVVIYGSATPDMDTAYAVHRRQMVYLKLPERIMGHRETILAQAQHNNVNPRYVAGDESTSMMIDLPPVQIVDMRAELKSGNRNIFSRALHTALTQTLQRGEQAILFLNRRGKNTFVFCRDCGYVAQCPNCTSALTYHEEQLLRCHQCGYAGIPPIQCPTCHSTRIKYFGAGTQEVMDSMRVNFPSARVVRWDADTASNVTEHKRLLARFQEQQADVLVGTQMIAKGLDLPMVTLVGVISADTALNLPDFRAGERTFQLLTQVAGRAGRGILGGQVILQTYQPEHYAIQTASKHDYRAFYEREIAYRRQLGYPPFRRMVRILFRYASEAQAQDHATQTAQRLTQLIPQHDPNAEIIGPAPCFYTRIAGMYRWHLIVRGESPLAVVRAVALETDWYIDVDPIDLL